MSKTLGAGMHAQVFAAELDGEPVAAKLDCWGAPFWHKSKVLWEAELLGELPVDHPHLPHLRMAGEGHRGSLWNIQDYAGDRIPALLRSQMTGSPGMLTTFGVAVLDALVATHARGIVHRDLHIDNILLKDVRDVGSANLIDFGGSMRRGTEYAGQPWEVAIPFLAPERKSPGAPLRADFAEDIYSIGFLLAQLATGHPPYDVADRKSLNLWEERYRAAPDLSVPEPERASKRKLFEILKGALARDPSQRPASAEDFRQRLSAAA